MKKAFFILSIVFSSILIQAQSDIIYTTDEGRIIFDCKIIEVKHGNMVFYTKEAILDSVEASSITKYNNNIKLSGFNSNIEAAPPPVITPTSTSVIVNNNPYQGLYRGEDYNYYMHTRKKALHKRNFGIILTAVGIGAAIAGEAMYGNSTTVDEQDQASVLYFVGLVAADVGVILWISGGIKAANNRKAMERTKNTNLSFGITNNGIGLKLAFN